FETSLLPDVEKAQHEDAEEDEHDGEAEPAETAKHRGPRPYEEQLDVEDDEEDRDRGELDGEASLGQGHRVLATLERLHLDERVALGGDERGDAEERPRHHRRDREHHQNRQVFQLSSGGERPPLLPQSPPTVPLRGPHPVARRDLGAPIVLVGYGGERPPLRPPPPPPVPLAGLRSPIL